MASGSKPAITGGDSMKRNDIANAVAQTATHGPVVLTEQDLAQVAGGVSQGGCILGGAKVTFPNIHQQ